MRLRKKRKLKNYLTVFLSVICTLLATSCFLIRIPSIIINHKNEMNLFAAGFVLPYSDKKEMLKIKNQAKQSDVALTGDPITAKNENTNDKAIQNSPISNLQDEYVPAPDEKTYDIIEKQFEGGGINYENFYVKNNLDYNLNIAEELSKKPDVNIKKDGSPQVLIIHTHTTEAYMDKDRGFYYENFYPRSQNNSKNVTRVGDAIKENLQKNGIPTIHDVTCHDNPSYNGSYSRAAETIHKNLSQNPSIGVVLDIHRDSIGNNESGKVKPTFVSNGKKAAQVMIMSGCDLDGSLEFPSWEYNLRLALRLQQKAETMYPGLTRAMCFDDVKYNMNITHGSLLIEVGTDANTLDEAICSGYFLGDALGKVLNELS